MTTLVVTDDHVLALAKLFDITPLTQDDGALLRDLRDMVRGRASDIVNESRASRRRHLRIVEDIERA